jgi:hypothetical protein
MIFVFSGQKMGIKFSTSTNEEGKIVIALKKGDKQSNDVFWDLNKFKLGKRLIKKLGVTATKPDPKAKGPNAWVIEKICNTISDKDAFLEELRRIKGILEQLEKDLGLVDQTDDDDDGEEITI